MALKKTLQDLLPGEQKKKKEHHFLNGLKDWVVSPAGIITIIGFIALVFYVVHKTQTKKA